MNKVLATAFATAFSLAMLLLTIVAAFLVLGAWLTVLMIAALIGFGVGISKLADSHIQPRTAGIALGAIYAVLIAMNVGSVVLLWLAFGPAIALLVSLGFYASVGTNYYLGVIKPKARGATTTWI